MRPFALALTLSLVGLAAPSQAQVSFSPTVGYDLDNPFGDGLSVGLAFELSTQLASLPLQPAIRPAVEYVFVDADDVTFVRANVDLLGRFSPMSGGAFLPYAKAGVTIEYFNLDTAVFGFDSSDTDVSLNVGGGVEFTRFFLEGELGLGGYSDLRLRAGYRF